MRLPGSNHFKALNSALVEARTALSIGRITLFIRHETPAISHGLGQASWAGFHAGISYKGKKNDLMTFFIYSLGPRKVPPKRPGTGRLREGVAWYSRNLETQGFLPGIARSPALSLTPDLRIQRLSKFYTIKYEQHLIAYGTCGEHSWDY